MPINSSYENCSFVAIDVETANPNMASICKIGLLVFENGLVRKTWESFIDPEDYFDDINVSIHGIDESDVIGAPTFKQVASTLYSYISGQVVVMHTSFDRTSLIRASNNAGLPVPSCTWLNTASVARRAWPEVSQKGFGLASLAAKFGINFRHHDPLDDAKTAGLILLKAIDDTQIPLADWIKRVTQPIGLSSLFSKEKIVYEVNAQGPLLGEVLAFTGALTIPRREASELATKAGCEIVDSVTKHTTLLVVGDQDARQLHGHEKSSKHRKAEDLIIKGIPIRIITESDFSILVKRNIS